MFVDKIKIFIYNLLQGNIITLRGATMKKKGQGLSVNTIIIAIIALIVLVVLIAVFTGRLGIFTSGTDSCINRGGTCNAGCSSAEQEIVGTDCKSPNNKCCVKVPGAT